MPQIHDTRPFSIRFWDKVTKESEPDGCWLSTSWKSADGYGRVTRDSGEQVYAHRAAWELRAPIPDGFGVLHVCDNPPCCRNDGDQGWYQVNGILRPRFGHLWVGTRFDNMADMVNKGRHGFTTHPERARSGSACPWAILTEDSVREIRRRHSAGEGTYRELAAEYGVKSWYTIRAVVKRRIWRGVE